MQPAWTLGVWLALGGAASEGNGILSYTLRPRMHRERPLSRRWFVGVMVLWAGLGAAAQNVPASAPASVANPQAEAPRAWAVDVVANELVALHHPGSYLRYRMHVIDSKGDQVRDVIESKDGSVARLILKDGKPLTEDEDKAERQRLNDMVASPADFAKHIKRDAEGKKLADQLMKLMPDAMIYSYTPGQPQSGKNNGAPEVVLDYKPNPKFQPPTTAAEALTGLEGRVWVDVKSRQLVRMEGTIFRPVNFGWGMLAHIYPGGHLTLEQTHVGGNRWIFTRFTEQVSVRALMVKSINIHADIEAGSFQILPGPISYQEAVRILLDAPLPAK
jgi:hypothetical protein